MAKLKLSRVPIGADPTRYRPGSKRRNQEAARKIDESIPAGRTDEMLRKLAPQWGVAPEDVDLWIKDPEAYSRLLDERARGAVDGGSK